MFRYSSNWSAFSGIAQRVLSVCAMLFILGAFFCSEGCRLYRPWNPNGNLPANLKNMEGFRRMTVTMEITGYDSGPESCEWTRDWLGRPVYATGPNKGKRKVVGVTASGTTAKRGTIAADTAHYPFGTIMFVPGYGYGTVEDRGGDIKGPHRLDLWFSTAKEARQWGRRKNVSVTVWVKE